MQIFWVGIMKYLVGLEQAKFNCDAWTNAFYSKIELGVLNSLYTTYFYWGQGLLFIEKQYNKNLQVVKYSKPLEAELTQIPAVRSHIHFNSQLQSEIIPITATSSPLLLEC